METKNRKNFCRFSGLVSCFFLLALVHTPSSSSNFKCQVTFAFQSEHIHTPKIVSFLRSLRSYFLLTLSLNVLLYMLLIMNQLLRSLLRLAPYFPLCLFARNMKSQQLLPLILDKCEFEYVIPWSEWSNFFSHREKPVVSFSSPCRPYYMVYLYWMNWKTVLSASGRGDVNVWDVKRSSFVRKRDEIFKNRDSSFDNNARWKLAESNITCVHSLASSLVETTLESLLCCLTMLAGEDLELLLMRNSTSDARNFFHFAPNVATSSLSLCFFNLPSNYFNHHKVELHHTQEFLSLHFVFMHNIFTMKL